MERKSVPFIATKIDSDLGIVEHIFAVFGVVDDGLDRIWPGAFVKTFNERGRKVRILDQHRTDTIMAALGKPLEMREIGRDELPSEVLSRFPEATGGAWARTQFLMNTPEGNGAFIRVKEGAVNEWSFGYDPLDIDYEEVVREGKTVNVRNLRTIRLWEYGPVLWGMNPATTTVSAKAETPSEVKPVDVTENTITISVFDSDECQADSFRTIPIGADDSGIQGRICRRGDATTTSVQAYIFDREKWTRSEAQDWVDEHEKEREWPMETKFAGSPKNRFGTHSSYKFKGDYAAAWRCHFSQVGGGALTPRAAGPIMGTVRRTEMIAAGMKPTCELPTTDTINARGGPPSPLKCSFPEKPSDYGLSGWDEPETDEDREGMKLSCDDLAVIKRAALAEVKRRSQDREEREEGGKSAEVFFAEIMPIFGELLLLAGDEREQELLDEVGAWMKDEGLVPPWEKQGAGSDETKEGRVLAERNINRIVAALRTLVQVLEDAGIDIPEWGEPEEEGEKLAATMERTVKVARKVFDIMGYVERVQCAFSAQFPNDYGTEPGKTYHTWWITELWDVFVIAQESVGDEKHLWKIPYSATGETVEFAPREQWTEGMMVFVPLLEASVEYVMIRGSPAPVSEQAAVERQHRLPAGPTEQSPTAEEMAKALVELDMCELDLMEV